MLLIVLTNFLVPLSLKKDKQQNFFINKLIKLWPCRNWKASNDLKECTLLANFFHSTRHQQGRINEVCIHTNMYHILDLTIDQKGFWYWLNAKSVCVLYLKGTRANDCVPKSWSSQWIFTSLKKIWKRTLITKKRWNYKRVFDAEKVRKAERWLTLLALRTCSLLLGSTPNPVQDTNTKSVSCPVCKTSITHSVMAQALKHILLMYNEGSILYIYYAKILILGTLFPFHRFLQTIYN